MYSCVFCVVVRKNYACRSVVAHARVHPAPGARKEGAGQFIGILTVCVSLLFNQLFGALSPSSYPNKTEKKKIGFSNS